MNPGNHLESAPQSTPTDPTANLAWSQKIRLLRRRFEHHSRNLLLILFRTVCGRALSSRNEKSLPKTPEERALVKKILIIRTGRALGDAVMSLVLIPECRQFFPHATIDLLLRDNISPLFKETENIDNVLELHPRFLKWPAATGQLLSMLRTKRYDLAIACDNPYKSSFTTLCLSVWTGAPWRLGFENEESHSFLNLRVSAQRGEKMVTNLRRLLVPFGKDRGKAAYSILPRLVLPSHYLAEADTLLRLNSKPVLIFIPSHWRKSWPLDSFLRVAKVLTENQHHVVLAFGPGDHRGKEISVQAWLQKSEGRGQVLPPKKLIGFAAVLARSRLFISNDCGPYHIAVAVGTPCIGIFLSEDALRDFGYSQPNHLVALYHPEKSEAERLVIETGLRLLKE